MADIVERLRAAGTPAKSGVLPTRKLYLEAANEIERLRSDLRQAAGGREAVIAECRAIVSAECERLSDCGVSFAAERLDDRLAALSSPPSERTTAR